MAKHNKLVDLKDAEIAKLAERADKLAGAQERLESLAKVHLVRVRVEVRAAHEARQGALRYSLEQEAAP